MKTALRTGAAALLLVGTSFAAPAIAQETPADPAPAQAQAQDQGRFQGPVMAFVTEFLGVTQGQVISNWATGNTLADLAAANGSSGEALFEAMMAEVNQRIDQALADGKIDEARAEELQARAEERLNRLIFEAHNRPGAPGVGQGHRQEILDVIEDTLGLNQGQIISHVRTGGTLAELAEENGSSGDELAAVLYTYVEEKVEAAVEDGKISEERGEKILANAEERIQHLVFDVHQPGHGRK